MDFTGYNTANNFTITQSVFNNPEYVVGHLDEPDTLEALAVALTQVSKNWIGSSFGANEVPGLPDALSIYFFWYDNKFYFFVINRDGGLYVKEIQNTREAILDYVFTPTVLNLESGMIANLEDLLPNN